MAPSTERGTPGGRPTAWTLVRGALAQRLARTRTESWADLLFVPTALALLVLVLSLTSQYFLTRQNITNVFLQGTDLACLSFGLTFVILAAELDLSIGGGAALASVVGAYAMRDASSVPLGDLVSVAVGLGIGLFNGIVVTAFRVPSFIATLGTMVIARGVALALTNGSVVSGLPFSSGNLSINEFLGVPWAVWIVFVVLFGLLYFVQTQTEFGLRVFAVGGNREAARLSAIPVQRIRLLCFLISGLTMGIAGAIITSRVESGQPSAANGEELYAVAAIVLGGTSLFGGRGSLTRTLWGVLFIVVLENGLDLLGVGDDLKRVVLGSVLIAGASTDFIRSKLRVRRTVAPPLLR